jgi:DNA-binding MarR family transcriptional regulator
MDRQQRVALPDPSDIRPVPEPVQAAVIALGHTFIALDAVLAEPDISPSSRGGLGLTGLLTLVAVDLAGPTRPTVIAQFTSLSAGGVTILLDRLERDGLVRRDYGLDPKDRRAVAVTLTDTGRGILLSINRTVVAQSAELVVALQELQRTADHVTGARHGSAGATPSVLVSLLGVVNVLDLAVVQVVGDRGPLAPTDPRPITLLFELGAYDRWLGDIPSLLGRSRGAVHTLIGRLEDLGLVERFRLSTAIRRGVIVRLTLAGRRLVSDLTDSLINNLPALSASTDIFIAAVAGAD